MNLQERIDAVDWYHDFDFGNGLQARSKMSDADYHRGIWQFTEQQLETVDFRGKSVLDIGCWDGYWSFLAEKQGASSVLATDDHTQNWAASGGCALAKELLNSNVEIDVERSVYDLESMDRKFDVVLFLGVFYHLLDPIYALAQIRHCCHDDTIVVMEGVESSNLSPATALYNLSFHGCEFMPTRDALRQLLAASYFNISDEACFPEADEPQDLPGIRYKLRLIEQVVRNSRTGLRRLIRQLEPSPRRVLIKCKPFIGENEIHAYPAPFGLHRYDDRFNEQ